MGNIKKIKVGDTTYDIAVNLNDYYDKTEVDTALSAKVDVSALDDIQEVIATALNELENDKADKSTTYTKTEVDTALSAKQDTLVSGTNIKTINNTSLLGSGNIDIQGGGSVTVDSDLSTTSENPVQNKVITNALNAKANASDVYNKTATDTLLNDKADKSTTYTKTEVDSALNSKADKSTTYTKTEVDTALASKADATALGGLSLVKLTQAEYDALATKDSNTLYVIVG